LREGCLHGLRIGHIGNGNTVALARERGGYALKGVDVSSEQGQRSAFASEATGDFGSNAARGASHHGVAAAQ
jgi:hypothetical protein